MARIGDRIGTYEITRLLGSGGMAMVYAAKHTSIGTDHALKVLLPNYASNPRTVERFRQEARAQFRMRHANIVQVTDFVEDGENLALVMDLIHGMTLAEAIHQRPGPWPVDDVVAVMKPVLEAMTYAHREGLDGAAVVHRDLKPENVMLDLGGDRVWPGVPKVMDFGIAKVLGASNVATATNARMGTPGYMSPEQFKNAKDAGAPADVWALGVMLWQLLAGRLPVDPENSLELIELYRGITPIPHLAKVVPGVPQGLSEAVAQALALEPSLRFADAGPLLRAVELGVARKAAVAVPAVEVVAGDPPPLPVSATVAHAPSLQPTVARSGVAATPPLHTAMQPVAVAAFFAASSSPAPIDRRGGGWPILLGIAVVMCIVALALIAVGQTPSVARPPGEERELDQVQPGARATPAATASPAPAAGPAPAPSHYAVDAASETVKDLSTGLVWQRGFSEGAMTWNDAKKYCKGLVLAGGGWRLPGKEELLTLVDKSTRPTIDAAAFLMPGTDWFWSATTVERDARLAWYVDFGTGVAMPSGVGYVPRVRCVRPPATRRGPAPPPDSANPSVEGGLGQGRAKRGGVRVEPATID